MSYLGRSFDALEVEDAGDLDRLCLWRLPESFLAPSNACSLRWRQDLPSRYLERDIPSSARASPRSAPLLGHAGSPPGRCQRRALACNLGVDGKTASSYIDLLADLLLARRLPSWHANVGKRLVKSPKVYVRDSGLVHALLAIGDKETLLSHPVVGASWEGFVIENLLAVVPEGVQGHFYRTSGGAEIDLVLSFPDGRLWAVEIKRSLSPRPERGLSCRLYGHQPGAPVRGVPGGRHLRRGG